MLPTTKARNQFLIWAQNTCLGNAFLLIEGAQFSSYSLLRKQGKSWLTLSEPIKEVENALVKSEQNKQGWQFNVAQSIFSLDSL